MTNIFEYHNINNLIFEQASFCDLISLSQVNKKIRKQIFLFFKSWNCFDIQTIYYKSFQDFKIPEIGKLYYITKYFDTDYKKYASKKYINKRIKQHIKSFLAYCLDNQYLFTILYIYKKLKNHTKLNNVVNEKGYRHFDTYFSFNNGQSNKFDNICEAEGFVKKGETILIQNPIYAPDIYTYIDFNSNILSNEKTTIIKLIFQHYNKKFNIEFNDTKLKSKICELLKKC